MLFAQFYQKSALNNNLIEACGDRAVIILDDRFLESFNSYVAKEECQKRGYLAYQLFRGENLNRQLTKSGPFTEL